MAPRILVAALDEAGRCRQLGRGQAAAVDLVSYGAPADAGSLRAANG
jgi:hypothetical protein